MWRELWRRSEASRHIQRMCSVGKWRRSSRCLIPAQYISSRGSIPCLEISEEVADAVAAGRPVVALETTLLTHGMPYPDNINTAVEVEEIVRSHSVVPATIGILDGRIYIGMSSVQLEKLAKSARLGRVVKVSRRDLAHTISKGMSGGTTVAATIMCARKAGIQVFVTGGLGGVHRHGEKTMDVSADIVELGRTPIAVVCAGVKSILDIGRTLEALETQGVSVATFGDADSDFPAFFTSSSGHKAPFSVSSVLSAAKLIDASLRLGVGSGVVIAVPIPDQYSAEGSEIETAIQEALQSAVSEGVEGKDITPFILQRVNDLTGGKSLQANVSLVKHNAHIGSCVARELALLQSKDTPQDTPTHHDNYHLESPAGSCVSTSTHTSSPIHTYTLLHTEQPRAPVVVGASIFDFVAKITSPEIMSEGTNPGSLHQTFGGVARNVAECMCRAGTTPFFISALGRDDSGRSLNRGLKNIGMGTSGVYFSTSLPTASYCVLLNSQGEMICGVGDMDIHLCITTEWVRRFECKLKEAPIVCVDGNIPATTLRYICDVCHDNKVPVWFEPTGADKATMIVQQAVLEKIHYISPNLSELHSIHDSLYGTRTNRTPIPDLSLQEKLSECTLLVSPLLNHVPNVFASLGRDGVVWGRKTTIGGENKLSHFSTVGQSCHNDPVNVSGAGDSFVGGMLSCLSRGFTHELAIKAGLRAANLSVSTMSSISPSIQPQLFTEAAIEDWAPWEPPEIT